MISTLQIEAESIILNDGTIFEYNVVMYRAVAFRFLLTKFKLVKAIACQGEKLDVMTLTQGDDYDYVYIQLYSIDYLMHALQRDYDDILHFALKYPIGR